MDERRPKTGDVCDPPEPGKPPHWRQPTREERVEYMRNELLGHLSSMAQNVFAVLMPLSIRESLGDDERWKQEGLDLPAVARDAMTRAVDAAAAAIVVLDEREKELCELAGKMAEGAIDRRIEQGLIDP